MRKGIMQCRCGLLLCVSLFLSGCKSHYVVTDVQSSRIAIDASLDAIQSQEALQLIAPYRASIDSMMNTVLGLLAKGDINCAGSELPLSNDLFASQQRTVITPETLEQRRARQASETPAGVIRTAEEVRRAEEEALRKKEEEERQAREKAEEEAREEERIRKENSFWNKGWKKLKNLGETILGPEEE